MTDTQRHPLFASRCPDCLGLIRWVNGRPQPHQCLTGRDDIISTPWKEPRNA